MALKRRSLEQGLARAERAVALLDRCRPLNAKREQIRVLAEWQRGNKRAPRWSYARAEQLAETRAELEWIANHGSRAGAWGRLFAERALELAAEADAADHVGSAEFRERAALRFPIDRGADGEQAEALARAWSTEQGSTPSSAALIESDNERDPESLISALRRAVGEQRLGFRVVASAELPCAAATGEDILLVRMGMFHTRREVRRIVLHELEAHALPRCRARAERLGLFRVATARGADDEEGRALLLEERAGFLDARRRAQLGRRHLAALSVRRGAGWVETVELLLELGTPLAEAIDLAARAHRGGGLGREVVYLTSLVRVRRALAEDPSLESFMRRGRISVQAAPILRQLGEPPDTLDTRSAA
jgi:hypothetical protein